MGEHNTNPLLEKVRMPGKTYQLPSRGLFYNNGELDEEVKDGEVHVHSYTALDELALNSADRLLTGKAVDEVFGRCVPQIKKPRQLLRQDVDFLLTCLRIESYGPEVEVRYTHTCENAAPHSYMVNIQGLVQKVRKIDPTTYQQQFSLVLSNGQTIKFKPLTFEQTLALYEKLALKKDLDQIYEDEFELDKEVLSHYVNCIDSVDGITDKTLITEWFYTIKASWADQVVDKVKQANDWGPATKSTIVCRDCGANVEIEVTTNQVSAFI